MQVAAVQVTAFINNTYHSLVQYEPRAPGAPLVAVDSRPSDAINLALRFGAPVYVHKKARASCCARGFNDLSELCPNIDRQHRWQICCRSNRSPEQHAAPHRERSDFV